jgi:hypothetical protein
LVKNCGTKIHVIVGDELFMTTLSKISRVWLKGFGSKSKMVGNYGLDTLQAWGEAFETRKYLYPHIYGTYTKLRAKTYVKFPGIQYDQRRVPIFLGPISTHEKEFVADYLLENQQMEDLDLLHFSESDDEDDHHHHHPPVQHEEDNHAHEQHENFDFFGLHMDTSDASNASNFPETVWPTTQSYPTETNFTPNWHQSFSSNSSTAQEIFNQENSRGDLFAQPQSQSNSGGSPAINNQVESKCEFDWNQFEAPRPSLSDAETQTKDTDKFSFFDDETLAQNNVKIEDFFPQKNEESPPIAIGNEFMALDPFQDFNFMIPHQEKPSPHQQLIQELGQQLKSRPVLKDENNPSISNPSGAPNLSNPKDFSAPPPPPPPRNHHFDSEQHDGGIYDDHSTHPAGSRPARKYSSYYDPSSDSKNHVVYFGTQRVTKREE